MKKLATFIIAAVAFSFAASAANTSITIEEAGKHVGETVTVCSKVFSSSYLESSSANPTLLNLGAPSYLLTIVINASDRKNFSGKPENDYTGKNVCVTGKIIKDLKGKPQIVVSRPQEIQIDGGGSLPEIKTRDFFWFE